jgi:4-methylaminobutanoate oxidase (formaldehyde-forming)
VKVEGFTLEEGQVTAMQTSRGPVQCEYVVNCAGQWAKAVAAMSGVVVPLQPAEHF